MLQPAEAVDPGTISQAEVAGAVVVLAVVAVVAEALVVSEEEVPEAAVQVAPGR